MQNARFSHLVPFIALIVVQAASSAVPNGLAERAHVTIQTLERQEDIRTPAEAPSWLIMDTLLAFGQDYLLQSEQEDGLHITFSERLSGNNEQPEAKEYSPLFCCEGKVIVADRGSSAAWGERHPFQFLWCMAEAGLPLSMPIKVAGHPPVTISQVCTDAEKRITEFSTLSWALPTIAQCRGCGYKWTNRFDEGLTIKYLLKALLSPDHRSDEYCANSHKAFAVARVLSLCSGETDFDCVEMRTARQWLDSFWAKYKENVQSDGRIDYQAVGWPTWPEESLRAAAEAGAAGHTLAWMALDCKSAGRRQMVDSVALHAIESLDATVLPQGLDGIFARGQVCHAVHGLRLYLEMAGEAIDTRQTMQGN